MGGTRFALFCIASAMIIACTTTQTSQAPAPQTSAPTTVRPDASPPQGAAPGGQPGQPGPGGPGQGRRPNPAQQDTLRRAQVDSIMRAIAGRETEPAGKVFKNVKVLKDMPAGEFLKNMNENYGRGLGMTCGNCHVIGQYDQDTRKNKRIARQMQEMTDYINSEKLAKTQEIDDDFEKITCVTCHAGSGHPRTTMPVPTIASPPRL